MVDLKRESGSEKGAIKETSMIKDKRIDHGREFDWGKTSEDYAKYRDIYPPAFYSEDTGSGIMYKWPESFGFGNRNWGVAT